VGSGFTVRTGALVSGSQDIAGLQGRCLAIAEDAVASLAAMADSAGHPSLSSALSGAAERGNGAFAGMWAAFGHASRSLAATATNYDGAEQANVAGSAGLLRVLAWRGVSPG
jgi:hypothetical protein